MAFKMTEEGRLMNMKVGLIIKKQRRSRDDVAAKLGCTRTNMYWLLVGKFPNPKMRERLAKELGFKSWTALVEHREVI